MTTNIIVLNYNTTEVDIYNCTTIRDCIEDEDESEVIEEFLTMHKGYNLNEINWLSSPTEIIPIIK